MKKPTQPDQATREELADYLTLLDQQNSNRFIGWVCETLTKAPDKSLADLVTEFRAFRTRRVLEAAGLPTGPAPAAPKPQTFAERQAIRRQKVAGDLKPSVSIPL